MAFTDAKTILTNHYLGSKKSGITFGLEVDGELVGVAVFGQPSREGIAKAFGGGEMEVIELIRFYTEDDYGSRGTWFLSRAIKLLDRRYEVIVAYSDPQFGHYGGLYQAGSWTYVGRSKGDPFHYEDANGNHINKNTPWQYAKRAGLLPGERPVDGEHRVARERGWVKVKDQPKYRYAFGRTKRARRRLKDMAESYPKPQYRQQCAADGYPVPAQNPYAP